MIRRSCVTAFRRVRAFSKWNYTQDCDFVDECIILKLSKGFPKAELYTEWRFRGKMYNSESDKGLTENEIIHKEAFFKEKCIILSPIKGLQKVKLYTKGAFRGKMYNLKHAKGLSKGKIIHKEAISRKNV